MFRVLIYEYLVHLCLDASSTITQNTTDVKHKINDHFDKIIQSLNARRHQLLDNINESKTSLITEINDEIETIDENNNMNSSEYLTNKLLSFSKSYDFNSDVSSSNFTNIGTINETSPQLNVISKNRLIQPNIIQNSNGA